MRAYPIDSPQAATRLLAMALVADGHLAPCELKTLDRLGASRRLGLSPEGIKSVIDIFCKELMHHQRGVWRGSAGLPIELRTRLLNEVRNPRVRSEVQRMCEAIFQADGQLTEGEADLLEAMACAWRYQPIQGVQTATP
ncbi:hypothetical protein LPB72_19355 [Hydrogenophaga crassostreae]|uniref:Co-chaperone DjlA N-terminal domain-containing protein n=1 Tax=Hydrogenophaga crassostreae TaxID=1763535 RepID=A0A167GQA7_9BURK|nr:TerB family tellurite resistance protein [Hydrogenophaga crassostreae]AOW11658.1 hypothetical protein LPB072_01090 [Hydrogenophaga crassostreae]OAD39750.1 hypothetical protein LPB72_19355 [Hydrogenophaga crassostreae]